MQPVPVRLKGGGRFGGPLSCGVLIALPILLVLSGVWYYCFYVFPYESNDEKTWITTTDPQLEAQRDFAAGRVRLLEVFNPYAGTGAGLTEGAWEVVGAISSEQKSKVRDRYRIEFTVRIQLTNEQDEITRLRNKARTFAEEYNEEVCRRLNNKE